MKKIWKERKTLEKIAEIISWVAVGFAVILFILKNVYRIENSGLMSDIAVGILCICQAYTFWNVKRGISWMFIVAEFLLVVSFVLSFFVV